MPVRKRRQKCLKVANFALLLVVFQWYRDSEGVNVSFYVMKKRKKKGRKNKKTELPAEGTTLQLPPHGGQLVRNSFTAAALRPEVDVIRTMTR